MGLCRIVIEGFTYLEMAVQAAEKARAAIAADVSISKVDVIAHPGEADEQTVKVYRALGYENA
jgi:ribosomal protein L24